MAVCKYCGADIPDGYEYCENCVSGGRSAPEESRHSYERDFIRTLPSEFRPLGSWAYFGYGLLFSIPIVGFIVAIILACGAASNICLRRFARYFIIWTIFSIIVLVIAMSVIIYKNSEYINMIMGMIS